MISFVNRLRELAAEAPDAHAVTCGNEVLTRSELMRRGGDLAVHLKGLGVGVGDLVTVAVPNSIEWFVSYVAVWMLGGTPQPVSSRLPQRELDAIIELADPPVVIGADPGINIFFSQFSSESGCVAINRLSVFLCRCDLLHHLGIIVQNAGEVHHLGKPDHAPPPHQCVEVARAETPPRALEARRRHARRRHEPHIKRDVVQKPTAFLVALHLPIDDLLESATPAIVTDIRLSPDHNRHV